MYKQSLVKTVEPVKRTTISRMNKGKKWKYGYDKEHNLIVLSHSGQIGEIIEIQNLVIALPKVPKDVYSNPKDKWVKFEQPKELERLKNIFDWRAYFHFLPLLSLLIVVFFTGSIVSTKLCLYII